MIPARARALLAALVATVALSALPSDALAATNSFSCRSSVVRLQTLVKVEPVVSNAPDIPCATDADGLPTFAVGPLTAKLLQSSTTSGASGASAKATVAEVGLNGLGTAINVVTAASRADATCVNGQPQLTGSSTLAKLTINGQTIVITGAKNQTVNLGLIKVVINQEIATPTRLTRRALFATTPIGTLTVAESTVNVEGSPCAPPPPPECSDGIDNDGDGGFDFGGTRFHPGDRQCTSPSDPSESS